MTKPEHCTELKFTVPARYSICVKGFLDESWSQRLSGMQINNQVPNTQTPAAEIVGEVQDQTELIGVLNSLYEMHLPIISVSFMNLVTKNSSQLNPNPDYLNPDHLKKGEEK